MNPSNDFGKTERTLVRDPPSGIDCQPPVVLTIAGSDCSAGAGIQADLKTFHSLGVYGLTAVTCVVAEIPGHVTSIEPVTAATVIEQIEVLAASFPIGAIKTGMLFSAETIVAVAAVLTKRARGIPLIVDPVMVATSGETLLEPGAVEAYRSRLFPIATLVTPNMDEAAVLTGKPIRTLDEMRDAVKQLSQISNTQFLLKGGHLQGDAIDFLSDGVSNKEFSAPRIPGVSTHGTGCTFSAAIAASLARKMTLESAIAEAKDFVTRAIRKQFSWPAASGKLQALNHESRRD